MTLLAHGLPFVVGQVVAGAEGVPDCIRYLSGRPLHLAAEDCMTADQMGVTVTMIDVGVDVGVVAVRIAVAVQEEALIQYPD